MNKLSPAYLVVAIFAFVGIVAVASHYDIDEQLRSYAIAVILPMLVKLLIDSQQNTTKIEEVRVQTNHTLDVLNKKLDIATAKNVQTDLDRAANHPKEVVVVNPADDPVNVAETKKAE